MTTNEDISYIAGLFDGEGSIYYARRKEKKKVHLEMHTKYVS